MPSAVDVAVAVADSQSCGTGPEVPGERFPLSGPELPENTSLPRYQPTVDDQPTRVGGMPIYPFVLSHYLMMACIRVWLGQLKAWQQWQGGEESCGGATKT